MRHPQPQIRQSDKGNFDVQILCSLSAIPLMALGRRSRRRQQARIPKRRKRKPGPTALLSLAKMTPTSPAGSAKLQTPVTKRIGGLGIQVLSGPADEDPLHDVIQLSSDNEAPRGRLSIFRLPWGGGLGRGDDLVAFETLLTEATAPVGYDAGQEALPVSFCNQIGCYSRIAVTERIERVQARRNGECPDRALPGHLTRS